MQVSNLPSSSLVGMNVKKLVVTAPSSDVLSL